MAESYAKAWTNKYNDKWYVGLRLNERGMFDQLSVYSRLHGDTGRIFLRNFSHAGTEFGCDRQTATRILRKLASDQHIELKIEKNGIDITICNYHYWQHVKKVGDGGKPTETLRKPVGKSAPKQNRTEQNRTEQNTPEQNLSRVEKLNLAFKELKEKGSLVKYLPYRIDLDMEQVKMQGWVEANPKKSNKKNWNLFIINWLNRGIEDAGPAEPNLADHTRFPKSGETKI